MKIHIVNIKYLKSADEVAAIRPTHREFLDTGYAKGTFLASGPKEDGSGGIILAMGDIDELKTFLANDPFQKEKVAEYTFTSFDAVKHLPELTTIR